MQTTNTRKAIRPSAETVKIEPWLALGDPLAEPVVRMLLEKKTGPGDMLAATERLAAEGDPACLRFLQDVKTIPPWVDFEAMKHGAAMAQRNAVPLLIALIHGALPTTYLDPYVARVLTATKRLEHEVPRRLFETGTLFIYALDVDELRPGGSVWRNCVRIRFMHTMVRLHIMASGRWPLKDRVPINLAETACGHHSFGTIPIRGMRKLGVEISEAEEMGFRGIWRWVTRLLGAPAELQPETLKEQFALDARLTEMLHHPDRNSQQLTRALFAGMHMMPELPIPKEMHEALSRSVLDPEIADALNIPKNTVTGAMIGFFLVNAFRISGFLQRYGVFESGSRVAGWRFLRNFVDNGLAGVKADYGVKKFEFA